MSLQFDDPMQSVFADWPLQAQALGLSNQPTAGLAAPIPTRVEIAPAPDGSNAYRCTIAPGDPLTYSGIRAHVAYMRETAHNNGGAAERWYRWDMFFPVEFDAVDMLSVCQVHDTPDGGEVWVTNELGASVTVLDAKTNVVKETVTFAPKGFRSDDVTPVGIAMTRDGRTAYVTLGRANHVAVVDVATRKVRDYVLVGNRAWGATLNRDESMLVVVNGLSDDISLVDTRTNKVLRSVPVGRVPHTAVIDD